MPVDPLVCWRGAGLFVVAAVDGDGRQGRGAQQHYDYLPDRSGARAYQNSSRPCSYRAMVEWLYYHLPVSQECPSGDIKTSSPSSKALHQHCIVVSTKSATRSNRATSSHMSICSCSLFSLPVEPHRYCPIKTQFDRAVLSSFLKDFSCLGFDVRGQFNPNLEQGDLARGL